MLAVFALLMLAAMHLAVQGGITARPPRQIELPPGITFGPVAVGKSMRVLMHVFESALFIAAMWLAAAGFGYPLRRWLGKEGAAATVVQCGLGMAFMLLVAWLAAWAGVVHRWSAWVIILIGGLLAAFQLWHLHRRRRLEPITIDPPWPLLLVAPVLGLMLTAACFLPGTLWAVEAFGYDVISYHLQLPRQWVEMGAMRGLSHNVYSYLPGLAEVGYLQLGALRGSIYNAIYTCQFLHVSMAVYAAIALGMLVGRWLGSLAGFAAAALLLATPWTVICSTSAYNELFALAFAAAALLIVFDAQPLTKRGALAAGLLLGAGTLSKLTAGPMLALSIGLIVLLRLHRVHAPLAKTPWRSAVASAALIFAAAFMTLCPYMLRNTIATGNPVFPFAGDLFGGRHWSAEQFDIWHRFHTGHGSPGDRFAKLTDQWLTSSGYAAVFGRVREQAGRQITHFKYEGGVSLLWLAALAAVIAVIFVSRRPIDESNGKAHDARPPPASFNIRRIMLACLVLLVVQLSFWMLGTMQAGRISFFTVLPACLLIAAAVGRYAQQPSKPQQRVAVAAVLVVTALFTYPSFRVFYTHTRGGLRPWELIQNDPPGSQMSLFAAHPVNQLPPDSYTYFVADAAVFYVQNRFAYFTAWDEGPLGGYMRQAGGDFDQITAMLRRDGFTHIWVSWSELLRIQSTIGNAADIDADELQSMAVTNWQLVADLGAAGLYALP